MSGPEKNSNSFFLFSIVVIAVGFLSTSCGKDPIAKPQPISKIEIPQWPTVKTRFSLGADSGSETYQGSIVVWAADASPAEISEVITASANNRLKMAALTKFRRTEITPREASRSQTVIKIAAAREEAKQVSILRQRDTASNWFEKKLLAGLSEGRLTAAEADRARSIFGMYCEAKIWETVSYRISAIRAAVQWGDRPSPAWLCENVYRTKGLLIDSTAARCSTVEGGSTYEQCLWKNGVFKTSFFADRFNTPFILKPDLLKVSKFYEWVEDRTFEHHFFESDSPVRVRAGFMENKKIRPGSLLNVGSVVNREFSDVFVPVNGEYMDQKIATIDQMSPWYLINEIEELSLGLGKIGEFSLAPSSLLIDGAEQDTRKAELLNELRVGLSAMHRRTSESASLGDVLLNKSLQPLSEPSNLAALRSEPVLSDIVGAIDLDSQKAIEQLEHDEKNQTAAIEAARKAAIPLEEQWIGALNIGAMAATADGVSEAFIPNSSLTLTKVSGQIGEPSSAAYIDVRFVINKGASVLSACWALADFNRQIECPDIVKAELGTSRIPALLSLDVANSKIVLSTVIADPELLGLGVKPASGGDQVSRASGFNNVDLSGLKDGTVSIELFGNEVDGMPFFTGKLFVKDSQGHVLQEGATSLMPYNK